VHFRVLSLTEIKTQDDHASEANTFLLLFVLMGFYYTTGTLRETGEEV